MNGFEGRTAVMNKGDKVVAFTWKEVPEGLKNISYVQGPGGAWWKISPFGSREPWRRFSPAPPLPEGFVELFGPRPLAHQ
ncbi:hypothetical protein LCGC14_1753360, partial [marine sediment metagenome]